MLVFRLDMDLVSLECSMAEPRSCHCRTKTSQGEVGAEDYTKKILQSLQDAQTKLVGSMGQMLAAQHEVLVVQKKVAQLIITRPRGFHYTPSLSAQADVGGNSHFRFDAGSRLVATYELLELCLLRLPYEDVLLAQ